MSKINIYEQLAIKTDSKIIMLVMDGLGGIPLQPDGKTEMETAKTPNINKIAPHSTMGLLEPVAPGVTPGSGPGHLGLFGYDPIEANIGRGVLSALGINFPLRHGDLCARVNFCTVDSTGKVTDRRAGRIPTDENKRIRDKILASIKPPAGVELFFETEKDHRAGLILRGKKFYENIADTDPQRTGFEPLEPVADDPQKGAQTVEILKDIISQIKKILADEQKANMVLLRGFAEYKAFPSIEEKYKLKSLALATYPMYRGLASLIGMDVDWKISSQEEQIQQLHKNYDKYDFFFIHIKYTDSSGEDGDFQRKVQVIEQTDAMIPHILNLKPDAFVIACDHSTPAKMKAHSWHRIPALLHSPLCRPDKLERFDETHCLRGGLNGYESKYLLPIAMAHAMKLNKFGA
ncbi:MAG: 2,3-bisphosphoglycerate-independent phosphoglycerate mutase [Candidatus Auribacterota bacterium]|nr:2,3-bisphosphoglycerate-independent phosphoglycerate mutase [Candidatus Auribacterota bacterium]